ncbi:MAG: hypothetical protein OQK82_02520 [Candidatus Pacearchaeota archaeon]|nr:hypothetical protein [Candidatus Pacearchaeota archaeon]
MTFRKNNTSFVDSIVFLSSFKAFLIMIVIFRISLDYVYVGFVSPVYIDSYLSFKLDFNIQQYVLSWLLFLPGLIIVNYKLTKFSEYFFLSAILALIAPLTSIYGLDASKPMLPVVTTIGSIFLVYLISNGSFIKVPQVPYFRNSQNIIVYLSWLLVFYLIIWYVISGAASNINFDPTKVYAFRDVNSKITDVGFLAYLNLWVYKFFTIFLVSYYLYRRRIYYVILLLCIQLLFYGVSAHKGVVFLPLLAISVWYYFRLTNRLIIIPIIYLLVIFISYAIYVLFEYELIAAMLIRRAFYVPAGLTFEWFDFFTTNEHVYWSDKILSYFIQYPYELNIPHTVGEHLLSTELGANNGYVSSAYAHAGIWGVIIYSLILGYIIKLFNVIGRKGIPLWFMLAITVGPLRAVLTSSDLLTAIVSHGLMIAFFILILFRSSKASNVLS